MNTRPIYFRLDAPLPALGLAAGDVLLTNALGIVRRVHDGREFRNVFDVLSIYRAGVSAVPDLWRVV